MKIENMILIGLLVVVLGGLVYAFTGFSANSNQTVAEATVNTKQTNLLTNEPGKFESIVTGDTGSGDVSVELTPREPENGKMIFDMSVNTHSVVLTQFNLQELVSLQYQGKSISPVSVPTLKGHHSSGELVFEIEEISGSFSIIIQGIPKVEKRLFSWSV